jgi:hypothetical protein
MHDCWVLRVHVRNSVADLLKVTPNFRLSESVSESLIHQID